MPDMTLHAPGASTPEPGRIVTPTLRSMPSDKTANPTSEDKNTRTKVAHVKNLNIGASRSHHEVHFPLPPAAGPVADLAVSLVQSSSASVMTGASP